MGGRKLLALKRRLKIIVTVTTQPDLPGSYESVYEAKYLTVAKYRKKLLTNFIF